MKDRRDFLKTLLVLGVSEALFDVDRLLAQDATPAPSQTRRTAIPHGAIPLPPVRPNPFSSEIVINSRISYHGGYSGTLSTEILSNVLWAAARAPMAGSTRTIYAALPENVYRYDETTHTLLVHETGNHLSEPNLAFEVGVAGELIEDAGIALHYAHLAACAFWVTTSDQPSCCPKESAATWANSSWNPQSSVHMVNSYGRMGTVSGITGQAVAQSSDGSLPDPATDGATLLEEGLANLVYGDQFSTGELTLTELSQIAWASYGCTAHHAFNGKAGLAAASSVARYFLTGRIYLVRSSGVDRYHVRLPSGNESSRDHRIETVTSGDRRPQLRSALPDLPQTAPNYFVFCGSDTSRKVLLEAGYCGAGALLQATSLGLQGYFNAGFTTGERSAMIAALSIPSDHDPLLVFSVG